MRKLFIGDGGSISEDVQEEYKRAFAAAQAAYDAVMAEAPAKTSVWGRPSPERAAFIARATAAFDLLEGPARAKRDAAWIPGPRQADYSIGLGESED